MGWISTGIDESYPYPENHGSSYAATKAMAERLIIEANSETLKTISLRTPPGLGAL